MKLLEGGNEMQKRNTIPVKSNDSNSFFDKVSNITSTS